MPVKPWTFPVSLRRRARAAAWGSVSLAAAATACRLPEPPAPRLSLIEKGASQSFYDAEGRLQRLLIDADGDRRADSQLLYRRDGTVESSEIDGDLDGTVDHWEAFRADGSLESRGVDENGDGRIDRREFLDAARVTREERDTDGDGRMDTRLHRGAEGELEAVEIERGGAWERRPVRRP